MPTTLTDSPVFDPNNVVVPSDGDNRNAASVNVAFQTLANRTKYLNDQVTATNATVFATRAGLNGIIVGAKNAFSSDGTHITVEGFYKHHINNAPYSAGAAASVAPGSDSNDTWHFLYAKDDGGGGIDYERSTIGPDASMTIKNGDPTRIYILSYYVDGSGNIRPFQKRGNKYLWRRSKISDYTIATAKPSTFTDQSLSAWVSPYSSMATIECLRADGTDVAEFRTNGDTTNVTKKVPIATILEFDIETDGSQVIEYRILGDTPILFAIYAVGYYE